MRTESRRNNGNDQNSKGPVYVRDLESSWAKPSGKSIRETDGVKCQGSQETYNSRKRHWSNLRKNQPQNITETINIPTKKVKNDHLNDQTIDLTHEISTENDNFNQNTSDSEIPNEESNIPVSNTVKPLIQVTSETVAVEDNQVKGPENDMKKKTVLAIPPLKHNPPDQVINIEQKRAGEKLSLHVILRVSRQTLLSFSFCVIPLTLYFYNNIGDGNFRNMNFLFLSKIKTILLDALMRRTHYRVLVVLEEKVAYLYCGLSNGEAE